MSGITKSTLLNAIKKIDDKNFNKNSLTLNSIKKLEQEGNSLTVDISIPHLNKETDFNSDKIVDAIKNEFPALKEIHIKIRRKKQFYPELKILLRLQAVKVELVKVQSL
jgi:hypothetical protein